MGAPGRTAPGLPKSGGRRQGTSRRASAAALWPERVRGLVTAGGYKIQNIAGSVEPAAPEREHRMW